MVAIQRRWRLRMASYCASLLNLHIASSRLIGGHSNLP